MKFLEKLALKILEDNESYPQQVVILPNVRARLFLNEHIRQKAEKAMFMPLYLTSIELMERLAKLSSADDYLLITSLFNAYTKVEGESDFETFMSWGITLLQDLKEIDHQLADTEELFANLNQIREMEFWNPGGGKLSEFQRKYLGFCEQLPQIYKTFQKIMESSGIAHLGYLERKACQNLNDEVFSKDSKVYLAGFNALTKAEETVFDFLKAHYVSEFIFDYDNYYLLDNRQEAGYFGRLNSRKYQLSQSSYTDHFKEIPKNIAICSCSTNFEQALILSDLLKKFEATDDYKDTVIILPEESSLLPVLQNLPEQIQDINVTMGFSLIHSPYYDFFERIIRLYVNQGILKTSSRSFYYKDVLELLESELLTRRISQSALEKFREKVVKENLIFIPHAELSDLLDLPNAFSTDLPISYSPPELTMFIRQLIRGEDTFLSSAPSHADKIKREFLLHHYEVLAQVEKMNTSLEQEMPLATFHKIWKHYTKLSKVQFTGEPLIGLQIMGLLESRNLDFKNVIIFNVNEGILPTEKRGGSLIPNDLKKHFGLQLNKEKDAVIAYHFYRLLQRSENVALLYSTKSGPMGGGEKSRFILQLEEELTKYSREHVLSHLKSQMDTDVLRSIEPKLSKNDFIVEKTRKKLEEGISASALLKYINCPLDFFHTVVLGLEDRDPMKEVLESDSFGSAIHGAMEKLFEKYIDQNMHPGSYDKMAKDVDFELKKSFSELLKSNSELKGRNALSFRLARDLVQRALKQEKELAETVSITPLLLEEWLEQKISLTTSRGEIRVNMRGIIDRVERRNGSIHIVDYKTGKVDSKQLIHESMDEDALENEKVFQLLTYALMLSQREEYKEQNIQASIFSMRSFKDSYCPLEIGGSQDITPELLEAFKNYLSSIVGAILDPETPFVHRDEALYCKFCK